MIIQHLGDQNSIANRFIYELRDTVIQQDPLRFRRNIERIGEILAYEFSKSLTYKTKTVTTPLGKKSMDLPADDLVLCSVLRAGIPLHAGLLNYFDRAENAFISAYRYHPDNGDDFEVIVRYFAAPDLSGKTLVLTDPMLATGKTLENVYKSLQSHGEPAKIHILSVIGSRSGIDYVEKVFPESTQLWIAAIDKELSPRGYIVPGLGDAGDLAYGVKL